MNVILSLYPNTKGLGYVCMEFPNAVYDFGMVSIRPVSNEKAMARAKKFIQVFRPSVIVVRDNAPMTGKGKRIEALRREIEEEAGRAGIPVHAYTRDQVKDVFEVFGARTKQEIADWIAHFFPMLADRLPKPKKFYEDEDAAMGIFDAMALALTHEYLSK